MSKRVPQVNQLIKKELSQILLKEIDFARDLLVTVTRVETSPDLNTAKIYVSIIPDVQRNRVLQILESQIYNLQQKLNQRLIMRPIPRIKFLEERKTSEAGRIEEVLEELKKEEK